MKKKAPTATNLADAVVRRLLTALDRRYRRQRGLTLALRGAIKDIYWMSAAADFGPQGIAYKGWKKVSARTQRRALLLAKAGM